MNVFLLNNPQNPYRSEFITVLGFGQLKMIYTGAALLRLREEENVLGAALIRLHQHGLPSLLSDLVVLALVLLVVEPFSLSTEFGRQ